MPMVVISFTLPQELRSLKHRPMRAGQFEFPIIAAAHPDDAALARSHSAGHEALDGRLTFDAARCGDLGDTFHHRLGPAGINDELLIALFEISLQGLGNQAVETRTAVIRASDKIDP